MTFFKKFIIIICIILIPQIIYTQNNGLKFEHITIKEGLSQNTVYSIIQDDKGFMWFGTETGGLNKYDGYCFKQYEYNHTDTDITFINNISKIYQDRTGIIWLATWGDGLIKFNPHTEKFTPYFHDKSNKHSLSTNNTQTIFEDSKGMLWVGTAGEGLDKFDREKNVFIHYKNNPNDTNSLINNRIWAISEDASGCLWICTSRGLDKFNPATNKFTHYLSNKNIKTGLSNNKVRTIYIDNKTSIIWVGTVYGLNKFNPKTNIFTNYLPYPNKIDSSLNRINVIIQDKNNNNILWIGTSFGGLCKFNKQTHKFLKYVYDYKNPNSLSYNDVRDICIDRSGIFWIATRGGGINKLDLKPAKFKHFKLDPIKHNSLNNNRITSIIEDENGIIWLGTNGGGVNKYNPKTHKFSYFEKDNNNPKSLSNDRIRTIFIDKFNTIWVGTNGGGLNKLDKKNNKFIHYIHIANNINSIADNDVKVICEDKAGILWIGTENGLDKFNPEKKIFKHYINNPNNKNSICNNRIFSLHIDKSRILWIGTDDGLDKFNPQTETFKHFKNDPNNKHSLSNNDIFSIFEDKKGYIWIGTAKGLNKFNRKTETFTTFNNYEISKSVIVGILSDDNNNLWLSTIRGLSKFNPETKKIQNYDVSDGLQSNEFTIGANCKLSTGELLFGGINGFNSFFPDSIKNNLNIPAIVLTDFKIFNKSVKIGKNSLLKKSISETKQITLSYKQTSFSFSFAALEFTNPKKNQYAYMLEGFDKNWNYAGYKKFANYTNISPGEYTFKVKASNNDGIWNNKGTSIKIIIEPPFWKTKWCYALEIFTTLLFIYFFIYFREKKLKHDKKILKHKVKIRTIELEQKNEEIQTQAEHLKNINKELKKLSIVASKTDNAVIIADNKGNIEWINDGFTQLYGYTLDEYLEKKGKNIALTSSNPNFYKIFKRCIEQKVSITYTSQNITKYEREIWVQTTLTPVLDNNDEITKFISIDSDITKMKQVENELETQRDKIEEQRDYINSQNIEITSSIYYAQNIQTALLPPQKVFAKIFPESFIFFKPKEIVSGDFYWLSQKQNKIYVAAADCTGHGVPGALLSMLGTAFLTEIVNENDNIKPNEILSQLRDYIGNSLHQTGEMGEMMDGLDISIISIDKNNNTLEFAGAMNPLFFMKKTNNNYSLTEIKGDRISIGVFEFKNIPFTNHKLKLQKGDTLYIFSDGYTDQFGGDNDEKFKKKRFKNVLLEMQYYSMNEQKEILIETFNKWKGANNQIDDILVLGIRI